jgi:hypothetical protein
LIDQKTLDNFKEVELLDKDIIVKSKKEKLLMAYDRATR